MNTVHPYFGNLASEVVEDFEVIWEGELQYQGEDIPVDLWLGEGDKLSPKKLDAFASFLKSFPQNESTAREQILKYLQADDSYYQHHLKKNVFEASFTLSAFVQKLELMAVSLWHTLEEGESSDIVVDYMISPEGSEEILAVHFHLDGSVAEVAWDS